MLDDVLATEDLDMVLKNVDDQTLLNLQLKLYWEAKHLSKMAEVTRYALSCVEGAARSPLLYNLAAFTCPWWSDSLEVEPELAKMGLEASRELLELRSSQGFEPIKVAGAHWILGCHYLYTDRNYERAVGHFLKAKELASSVEHEHSYLIAGNAIEGIGRAKKLLKGDNASEEFQRARKIYSDAQDEYSLSEMEAFLKS